ncbi:MAG TPA: hypothetical protein PKV22_00035 [Paludibacteraceae bacterium]|nr:hypothetical protein [Paludibacteraceae bacterium]
MDPNDMIYPEMLQGITPVLATQDVKATILHAATKLAATKDIKIDSATADAVATAAAQTATQTAAAAVKNSFAASTMNREQRILYNQIANFTEDTKNRIKNGNAKMKDATIYIRKDITAASGIIKLFDDTIDRVEGISNISKQKLAEGVNMLVSRLEWKFAYDTKAAELAAYVNPAYGTTYDAVLNGEVEITVGNEVKFRGPARDLMQVDRDYPSANHANGMNLKSPFFVPEKTDIQINIITAKGGSVSTAGAGGETTKVEFVLKGVAVAPIR